LGGRFLARLRVLGHAGERAVGAAALPLQLKLLSLLRNDLSFSLY
jgi:hypothetical protein